MYKRKHHVFEYVHKYSHGVLYLDDLESYYQKPLGAHFGSWFIGLGHLIWNLEYSKQIGYENHSLFGIRVYRHVHKSRRLELIKDLKDYIEFGDKTTVLGAKLSAVVFVWYTCYTLGLVAELRVFIHPTICGIKARHYEEGLISEEMYWSLVHVVSTFMLSSVLGVSLTYAWFTKTRRST